MIDLEVHLTQGESEIVGTVIQLLVDEEDKLVGISNLNPWLNNCLYEVKFDDGFTKLYNANTIASNV